MSRETDPDNKTVDSTDAPVVVMMRPLQDRIGAQGREQERQLLAELRAAGHEEQAGRLATQLHAREMAGLAADVYQSARHAGAPPPGWTRGSADFAALRALGLNSSDAEIEELLQPKASGFRAEIYIPDPVVHGADARPVLVFKGSTGPIADPDAPGGIRESGGEDYVHNVLQGLGEKSDYYDRAMNLALTLKRSGIRDNFEITAHSLGGGMASAAASVSGVPTTTFNAAGLHPNTVTRFLRENNLSERYDPQALIAAYQADGEILNEAQLGSRQLGVRERMQLGFIASQLTQNPELKTLALGKLADGILPRHAMNDAQRLLDTLGNARSGIADVRMPPTAGNTIAIPAMMYDEKDQIVFRPDIPSLREAGSLGGPLLDVVTNTVIGAKAGYTAGQPIAWTTRAVGNGFDAVGDVSEQALRIGGKLQAAPVTVTHTVAGMGTVVVGEGLAYGRTGIGYAAAGKEWVLGEFSAGARDVGAKVTGLFGFDEYSQGLSQKAESIRAEADAQAQRHIGDAQAGAASIRQSTGEAVLAIEDRGAAIADGIEAHYAVAGKILNASLDAQGRAIENGGKLVQAGLTLSVGAAVGLGTAAEQYSPTRIQGWGNILQTQSLVEQGGAAIVEGISRHSMTETVIPTMIYRAEEESAKARCLLQESRQRQPAPEAEKPAPDRRTGARIDDPAHPDHALFRGAQDGVYGVDARFGRTPDLRSDQLSGTLAARAKEAGMPSIGHVVLGDDRKNIFAATTADVHSPAFRFVSTDVLAGMNQPLSVSTQQIADAQARQETQRQAQSPQQQQQQEETVVRSGPRMV
ncbi:MAG: hypothetical protein LBL59_04945 [Xanthomonadaceae bacterium]|nr:hypothetical protein [Xanthomonadaceae bacterium]